MSGSGTPFDLRSLYDAVDDERTRRGLTWAAVSRETRVSASTIRRWADADDAEADGVLALLGWLGAAPETFVANARTAGRQLPPARAGMIRVDMQAFADASGQRSSRSSRTTIQRLTAVALQTNRAIASMTRWSET